MGVGGCLGRVTTRCGGPSGGVSAGQVGCRAVIQGGGVSPQARRMPCWAVLGSVVWVTLTGPAPVARVQQDQRCQTQGPAEDQAGVADRMQATEGHLDDLVGPAPWCYPVRPPPSTDPR